MQPSSLPEIKYKSQSAHPLSIYGLIEAGFLSESGFSGLVRRASLTDKRSFVFVLAGFPVMAKSAIRTKCNPENPDSDKDARSPAVSHMFRYPSERRISKPALASPEKAGMRARPPASGGSAGGTPRSQWRKSTPVRESMAEGWRANAVPNPLDSRLRGNDGAEIGNDVAIIAQFGLM